MGIVGRVDDAGETSLAAATAAIITARWTAASGSGGRGHAGSRPGWHGGNGHGCAGNGHEHGGLAQRQWPRHRRHGQYGARTGGPAVATTELRPARRDTAPGPAGSPDRSATGPPTSPDRGGFAARSGGFAPTGHRHRAAASAGRRRRRRAASGHRVRRGQPSSPRRSPDPVPEVFATRIPGQRGPDPIGGDVGSVMSDLRFPEPFDPDSTPSSRWPDPQEPRQPGPTCPNAATAAATCRPASSGAPSARSPDEPDRTGPAATVAPGLGGIDPPPAATTSHEASSPARRRRPSAASRHRRPLRRPPPHASGRWPCRPRSRRRSRHRGPTPAGPSFLGPDLDREPAELVGVGSGHAVASAAGAPDSRCAGLCAIRQ